MLGYRVSYRAVRIGDEEVEEWEVPTYNFTVRKTTLDAVIEGLDTYTRYQINVSGFSRKGDGPSAITDGGMINNRLFLRRFSTAGFYCGAPSSLLIVPVDFQLHLQTGVF